MCVDEHLPGVIGNCPWDPRFSLTLSLELYLSTMEREQEKKNGCKELCVSPWDCKRRIKTDLSEAVGPIHRGLLLCELSEKILALISVMCLGVSIIYVWLYSGSIQLSYGHPVPIFIPGACICDGEFCPDVGFTFNLNEKLLDRENEFYVFNSDPNTTSTTNSNNTNTTNEVATNMSKELYYRIWQHTQWWELDIATPRSSSSFPENAEDLLYRVSSTQTDRIPIHDISGTLKAALEAPWEAGEKYLTFTVSEPMHALFDGVSANRAFYTCDKYRQFIEQGSIWLSENSQCVSQKTLQVLGNTSNDDDSIHVFFSDTVAYLEIKNSYADMAFVSPIPDQGPFIFAAAGLNGANITFVRMSSSIPEHEQTRSRIASSISRRLVTEEQYRKLSTWTIYTTFSSGASCGSNGWEDISTEDECVIARKSNGGLPLKQNSVNSYPGNDCSSKDENITLPKYCYFDTNAGNQFGAWFNTKDGQGACTSSRNCLCKYSGGVEYKSFSSGDDCEANGWSSITSKDECIRARQSNGGLPNDQVSKSAYPGNDCSDSDQTTSYPKYCYFRTTDSYHGAWFNKASGEGKCTTARNCLCKKTVQTSSCQTCEGPVTSNFEGGDETAGCVAGSSCDCSNNNGMQCKNKLILESSTGIPSWKCSRGSCCQSPRNADAGAPSFKICRANPNKFSVLQTYAKKKAIKRKWHNHCWLQEDADPSSGEKSLDGTWSGQQEWRAAPIFNKFPFPIVWTGLLLGVLCAIVTYMDFVGEFVPENHPRKCSLPLRPHHSIWYC